MLNLYKINKILDNLSYLINIYFNIYLKWKDFTWMKFGNQLNMKVMKLVIFDG